MKPLGSSKFHPTSHQVDETRECVQAGSKSATSTTKTTRSTGLKREFPTGDEGPSTSTVASREVKRIKVEETASTSQATSSTSSAASGVAPIATNTLTPEDKSFLCELAKLDSERRARNQAPPNYQTRIACQQRLITSIQQKNDEDFRKTCREAINNNMTFSWARGSGQCSQWISCEAKYLLPVLFIDSQNTYSKHMSESIYDYMPDPEILFAAADASASLSPEEGRLLSGNDPHTVGRDAKSLTVEECQAMQTYCQLMLLVIEIAQKNNEKSCQIWVPIIRPNEPLGIFVSAEATLNLDKFSTFKDLYSKFHETLDLLIKGKIEDARRHIAHTPISLEFNGLITQRSTAKIESFRDYLTAYLGGQTS